MLKITKFKNPKLWYQKLILKLFDLEFYHVEFELSIKNFDNDYHNQYYLRSNYSENNVNNIYISNLQSDLEIELFKTTLEQNKEIFEYFISVNKTKYNFFQIFIWLIDYKFKKIDIKDFKNNTINNKYNCYNHFININKIMNNKLK